MRVVFPAPFLPIKAILSFSLIANEILLKRESPLNSTANPLTEIINVFLKLNIFTCSAYSIVINWFEYTQKEMTSNLGLCLNETVVSRNYYLSVRFLFKFWFSLKFWVEAFFVV